jgi:hypothetical protein
MHHKGPRSDAAKVAEQTMVTPMWTLLRVLPVLLILSACGSPEYAVPSQAISRDIDASQFGGTSPRNMDQMLDFRDSDLVASPLQ